MAKLLQDSMSDETSIRHRYWDSVGFNNFYKMFRRGKTLPKSISSLPNSTKQVENKYHLRGFQFGNWLTADDRYNYLAALYVCLYDLNSILRFKNYNVGLDGALGISFGARGKSRAVAHYEPWSNIINMTRYKDIPGVDKKRLFKNTGGVGSLAHEYGHFLDYYFGSRYETHRRHYALTNGDSSDAKKISYYPKYKMRNVIEQILQMAYFEKGKPSRFYKRIRATSKRKYFVQRNEIFARLFEQYISYKLKEKGILNSFLTDTKYSERIYMKPQELKKVVPLFDKLIVEMRKYF